MISHGGNVNIQIKEKDNTNEEIIRLDPIIKKRKSKEVLNNLMNNRDRCTKCDKKLKLTDTKCRCNNYYCSVHRYSDCHDCPFDYKTFNKELLEKQNPTVTAQRIDKI
jgi:predicted nucleic acid binding AN1-type Zn finger protein